MRITSKAFCRALVLALIVPLSEQIAWGQVYPNWFLNQGSTKCIGTTIGYANSSFYADSAIAEAIRNAYENYSRNRVTHVAGGQAFWSTEAGTFWMGADFQEDFDTTAMESAPSFLSVLDMYVDVNIAVVLLGDSTCRIGEAERLRLPLLKTLHAWSDTPPKDERYYYAVGVAPQYYYETSSWIEAERIARRNLARTLTVSVRSLQKSTVREGQEIRQEELKVTLRNIEVMARWIDASKKLFYVLSRTPKPN
jgi:hypothetical protein